MENNIQTKTKLIPKLRFKEFEGEWKKKFYGDIYSFYSTNSLSRDKLNYEKGLVKNVHYGDIHTKFSTLFDIKKEVVPFINEDINLNNIKEESYCKEGDLLIADASEDYNDIGKTIELVNLNNEKILSGLHTFLARPDKYKMQIGFSGYLLQSWKVRKQIMVIAQGTKVLSLSTGRLSKVKLNIPSLKEQQKIATFLTAVDTKIQQLGQKKELLANYKKGVMQQLFPSSSSGQVQLRFKNDDGSAFPDWHEKKLGEEIKYYKENSTVNDEYEVFTSSNNGLMLQSDYYGENRLTGRNNTGFNIIPRNYITYRSRSDNRKFHFNLNNLGATGIISTYYPVFISNKGSSSFLVEMLNYYQNMIGKYSVGTSQTVLSYKGLSNIKFNIPCSEEQQKIATFLSALDTKIANVQTQIEKTQIFKKGLLQQMFV